MNRINLKALFLGVSLAGNLAMANPISGEFGPDVSRLTDTVVYCADEAAELRDKGLRVISVRYQEDRASSHFLLDFAEEGERNAVATLTATALRFSGPRGACSIAFHN